MTIVIPLPLVGGILGILFGAVGMVNAVRRERRHASRANLAAALVNAMSVAFGLAAVTLWTVARIAS